jgi:preprotein translocase subunit YajC
MEFFTLVQLLAEGEEKQPAPDIFSSLAVPLIGILILAYFLLLRPQRREQATRDAMLAALKKNDRVQTIGGILGTVANISADGKEVTVKVDDNARIKFIRSSIQRVLSAEGEAEKPAETKT